MTKKPKDKKDAVLCQYFLTNTTDAKCMYNTANFYIRNTMTGIQKSPEERTANETEVLRCVFNGILKANVLVDEKYDAAMDEYNKAKELYDEAVEERKKAAEQYELIREKFPEVVYDPLSHILKIEKKDKKRIGKIAVCTAGTADISVAEEAAQTAEYFGANVERIYDVGVSGIHRLLSRLDTIQSANCVVAVAGMEGALASVLGGLVDKPVIAVPTSVGYGASMNGLSALLTMINSCANGIAVVNIDNGYGAGYIATQINRMGVHKDE